MVETDWREILSLSQRELAKADKEKLCESLSWMEVDDIELNFTDLKTLFRLSQDILKYKSEQVNNLLGQLETAQKKSSKGKSKGMSMDSPTRSNDSVLDTIAHQEEVIKANKEILEQLYADIAELEGKKDKLENARDNLDHDSESSRDVLSEMNQIAQLENEVTIKNRHIRKLLGDVKILEEENSKLKGKVSVLNEKLTEATEIIENLTEQLFGLNNENSRLKNILGEFEQSKAKLSVEIDLLKKQLLEKESAIDDIYGATKAKILYWKNLAKIKNATLETALDENAELKENLALNMQSHESSSPKKTKRYQEQELKIKELQEKLSEASNEILESANVIELLKIENKQLKSALEESHDMSVSDTKNESDDGKERALINKLKKKVKSLTFNLQGAEEMITAREKELTEIAAQLQLLRSDEGINALLEGLKSKKRKLKMKDEGIKSLVQEVNSLNQTVEHLQMENESMRQKLKIPTDEKIPVIGTLKKHQEIEQKYIIITKELQTLENKLVLEQLDNRKFNRKTRKLVEHLTKMGCTDEQINEICCSSDEEEQNDKEAKIGAMEKKTKIPSQDFDFVKNNHEMKTLIEENDGLRKGLQEVLDFLKDNSTTTSGVLSLQCPSLEAILNSMEARHAAGWFAPHMRAVLELKSEQGGKDALLTALHEARKETYEVINKLSKETEKSQKLQQKLQDIESRTEIFDENKTNQENIHLGEFGSWMAESEPLINDFTDENKVEEFLKTKTSVYESELRNGLIYFNAKFKTLFDKMTSIAINTVDEQNRWRIQEEKYKAEIETLKQRINQNDEDEEDRSDVSPGAINFDIPNLNRLKRKCSYLEESYKYIRTQNENLRNEFQEARKEIMVSASEYETQIQNLTISVANLTNKLRSSISLDMFWKQNEVLNEITTKYRALCEKQIINKIQSDKLLKRLQYDKSEIINHVRDITPNTQNSNCTQLETAKLVLEKQLHQVCSDLDEKNKEIENLQQKFLTLQNNQARLIDDTLKAQTQDDIDLMKDQIRTLSNENKVLHEQCQHVQSQLEIVMSQLQDFQHREMSEEMEINMLRHQILDLQSVGENKAIIAKLSGEVLVAHLQASESHKKIERLSAILNKEKVLRAEAEEMLRARQKVFDVYAYRYESKFRYLYEVMQVLRQQYQGCFPAISIENYLSSFEDLTRESYEVNEKLNEIEDLQFNLMTKHSVCDQILSLTKNKCIDGENMCPHRVQKIVVEGSHLREIDHYMKKLNTLEQFRKDILKRYDRLEKTLLIVNQGFEKSNNEILQKRSSLKEKEEYNLEVEDVHSDEDSDGKGSGGTITLSKPRILKHIEQNVYTTKQKSLDHRATSPIKFDHSTTKKEAVHIHVQTMTFALNKEFKAIQTEKFEDQNIPRHFVVQLENEINRKNKELNEALKIARDRVEEVLLVNTEKNVLNSKLRMIEENLIQKDRENNILKAMIENLRSQMNESRDVQSTEIIRAREISQINNQTLINAMKQFENDKNNIITEYKELLRKEREEYIKSVTDLQKKVKDLQTQLDKTQSEAIAADSETLKEVNCKYTNKIAELEEKCFKLQHELDGNSNQLVTYQSEVERWKSLASERLTKMEQLSSQLEARHSQEVESYKAENEHWISQLTDTQKEHMELRTRLSEQKASYIKQLADKDAHIEHLKSVIHGLKTQMMTMQTMMSINDPSFDLSAIIEVEEGSDALSTHGSERLELKYESSVDLRDTDELRHSASSTTVWQEPVIERLRREKQLTAKQNTMLRRQIKALAARERRARLDAQNLKNQVFRISTSGHKVVTAETAALHNKIASLQAQLLTARRDNHSTVALWDKWKRAQQASERWQARYEEKCHEVKKLESCLAMSKSGIARLEKEKKILLQRLNEVKSEKLIILEKQDSERSEKPTTAHHRREELDDEFSEREPAVSTKALMDRIEAQQRRIVALETADKGNEHLVSEYEKALAEITSLKGQVLKLESTLLETQIKIPIKITNNEHKNELEHWKSYCEMLKEENVQLNLKVSAVEAQPASAHQHRINDLEQTILTLRGLVSKLQSENKSGVTKRSDSRPNSGRSIPEKSRSQMESYRTEISNLKRTIQDKDMLLERSKEMLKIAAEREDDLLQENASLRRQVNELLKSKGYSAE